MKKAFIALCTLILLCGCAGKAEKCRQAAVQAPQGGLNITKSSKYQIIYPDLPANSPRIAIYTRAANMLRQALKEGVGVEAPIRMESKALKGCKAIYLGDTKAARAVGIKVADHPNFGFVIKEKEGNIYIAGMDKSGGFHGSISSWAL